MLSHLPSLTGADPFPKRFVSIWLFFFLIGGKKKATHHKIEDFCPAGPSVNSCHASFVVQEDSFCQTHGKRHQTVSANFINRTQEFNSVKDFHIELLGLPGRDILAARGIWQWHSIVCKWAAEFRLARFLKPNMNMRINRNEELIIILWLRMFDNFFSQIDTNTNCQGGFIQCQMIFFSTISLILTHS